ncbi:cytochrome c/c1 heme-lyase [Dimargaris cristalligena]|uniref:Holocytochrome c-type synthase n=1 Tax=Dimargaris cristalligena TaxID=215637 RepID=A0A4P9ZVU8_9FUNG|nr:cytochrome c/c1 heme-lyase [Dimargaris cristalligena]|eukprot:RKP37071.1 cytochrome c/c1 heme-lyase [Dimargaris cristalligena]
MLLTEVNPLNMMPEMSQERQSGQSKLLSQEHSDNSTWMYPSEQQFYNAMKRKNWEAKEEDMEAVVSIHNIVNEMAWRKVLKWEQHYKAQCPTPKLVRFEGRPTDISPKARFRNFIGYKLPFDRHDWVVDRCGQEVTYIIDFYSGRPKKQLANPESPDTPLARMTDIPSFFLDVRPKLTPQSFVDRVRQLFSKE